MLKKSCLIISLLVTLAVVLPAAGEQQFASLHETCDPVLQQGLQRSLAVLRLDRPAQRKALSVVVVDITNLNAPRMAFVNPDEMMYAASLPKIAILLGAFERISQGEMTLDENTLNTLNRMIRNSDNAAATQMMNRVGKEYLVDLLQSPRYRLYDPAKNGGLWVGKEYSRTSAWKRDPLHHISHGATAWEVARFYYLLATGRLVSPKFSGLMKSILANSAIHHKFVKGLEAVHPDSRIYRKSGTWRQYHADSALIERAGRRYIAVALAHSPKGGQWLSDLIVALDRLICRAEPSPPRVPRVAP